MGRRHITIILAGLTLIVLALPMPASLRDALNRGGFFESPVADAKLTGGAEGPSKSPRWDSRCRTMCGLYSHLHLKED